MANEDSFLSEVTEEVRRDKLYKLFRKYGWIAAVLVVAVVAGTSWNEWRKAQAAAEAQATGDALLVALADEDPTARASAIAALETGENAARNAVLALLQSDAALESGDRDAARDGLLALADTADAPQAYRDLATVKWTILGAGDVPPDERIGRLNAIALGAGAFRLLAMEQIALAEVEKGNTAAALSQLSDIINDAGVTQDLRVRATQLIVSLGGDPQGG